MDSLSRSRAGAVGCRPRPVAAGRTVAVANRECPWPQVASNSSIRPAASFCNAGITCE